MVKKERNTLNIVVKGTESIEEYKELKEAMNKLAAECSNRHRHAIENWTEGEPVKVWFDVDGHLCIQYESGNWWHYSEKGEWW